MTGTACRKWRDLASSEPGTFTWTQWGISTDIPVIGDYDRDGRTDIAVRCPSTGVWQVMKISVPGA